VVTFLFNDIEGSTRRCESDADAMRSALVAHDTVLRTAIEAHDGFVFSHTTTAQLLAMAAWLRHWHGQRVVMESTSTYWKGVYYLLEAEGFDCWLVNAREVKNVPGRAKIGPTRCGWPRWRRMIATHSNTASPGFAGCLRPAHPRRLFFRSGWAPARATRVPHHAVLSQEAADDLN
jgi:Transposase